MIDYSAKQKEIIKYVKKYDPIQLVLEGAVRSGKTFLNNILFILHVAKYQNKKYDFIVTGHTIGSIERNIVKPLREMLGYDIRLNIRNNFDLFGNKIHCFGSDKYDSYKQMTGMTSYGWYANEVTLQHRNTISEAFNRCSGEGSRIFWDTNPDYPEHFVKREYIDKSGDLLENGKIRIKSFHFMIDDNPMLPLEYIENLKASTPPGMWYDRKIKGLWVAAEGAVYELFNRNTHVIEPFKIPDHWQRYRVIDYGYTNPFVCLWAAVDEDGRVYVYHEYYKDQTLLKDHAAYINSYIETKENGGMIRYTDTIADHDAQDNAEMKNYGIRTRNANKTVNLGIEKVSERMVVQRDGKPRLFIFRNCEHTIREHSAYRWQEHKDGKPIKEEPLKVNDHTCDALRYLIADLDLTKKVSVSDIPAGYLGL